MDSKNRIGSRDMNPPSPLPAWRLNDWKQEVNKRDVDRRKSAAVASAQDFLKTPEGKAKNSTNSPNTGRRGSALPRMYR